MSLSYFPLFPDDFEADTAHLTLAEDGAYNRLLRLCWRTPGCSVPADREWIYRRMRALSDDDKRTIDVVIDEFFIEAKQRLSNARLMREYENANEKHERRKNAGKKGGLSKPLKTKKSVSSNAKAMHKQPEPEPEPLKEIPQGSTSLSVQRSSDIDLEIPDFLKRTGPRGTRLPEDWKPKHVDRAFADLAKCTVDEINAIAPVEFAKFTNYWTGKAGKDACKVDWDATWRNWLLKACQDQYPGRHAVPRSQRAVDPLAEAVSRRLSK